MQVYDYQNLLAPRIPSVSLTENSIQVGKDLSSILVIILTVRNIFLLSIFGGENTI